MRIAVISKSDTRGGGASVVAGNLAKQYQLLGHEADHINLTNAGDLNPYGNPTRIVEGLKKVDAWRGYRDHRGWEILTSQSRRLIKDYDAIHLHDMSTVYSHEMIGWLANRIPTVWTIHDCSPFTAGCLYPGSCTGFHSTCGSCPQVRSWPIQSKKDRTRTLHRRRRKIIENSRIHFTAPSRWMIGEFLKGGYSEDRITYVPNGVDKNVFRPRDKAELRKKYGLHNHQGPLILFSAAWLHDSRKGPHFAARICRQLSDLNPKLLLVGRYSPEAAAIFDGLDVHHAGFVKGEAERAELYAMADLSLMLSEEENAPLIVLECLASNTPVFGFAVGGVAEMITQNKSKPLVEYGDTEGISKIIRTSIGQSNAIILKNYIHHNVFDYKQIATFYLSLFDSNSSTQLAFT